MKRTTIQDIARETQLSVATVSKIINNVGSGYGQETYDRVMKAVRDMNYIPNHMARSIVKKKSMRFGIVAMGLENPFCVELIRSISRYVQQNDYSVLLFESSPNPAKQTNKIMECLEMQVDGIFIHVSSKLTYNHQLRRQMSEMLQQRRIPAVLTERELFEEDDICKVLFNFHKGAYMAVRHLIALGHRKIAAVLDQYDEQRYRGYCDALQEAGIQIDDGLVFRSASLQEESGQEALEVLLSRCPEISAVFMGQDIFSMSAYHYCQRVGIRLGQDLSIVGLDDIPTANLWSPPLTTIHQPAYQMGQKVGELLIKQVKGESIEQRTYVFEPELIIRGSACRNHS